MYAVHFSSRLIPCSKMLTSINRVIKLLSKLGVTLHSDLYIPYVHAVMKDYIHKHRTALESHPNPLVEPLTHTTHTRRLKRRWTFDEIK